MQNGKLKWLWGSFQLYVSGTSTGAILGKIIVLISLCCGTRPFELCIAGASVGGGVS